MGLRSGLCRDQNTFVYGCCFVPCDEMLTNCCHKVAGCCSFQDLKTQTQEKQRISIRYVGFSPKIMKKKAKKQKSKRLFVLLLGKKHKQSLTLTVALWWFFRYISTEKTQK